MNMRRVCRYEKDEPRAVLSSRNSTKISYKQLPTSEGHTEWPYSQNALCFRGGAGGVMSLTERLSGDDITSPHTPALPTKKRSTPVKDRHFTALKNTLQPLGRLVGQAPGWGGGAF